MGEFYFKQPDELYHYGIKGMKWGVRHDPERSGNGRGSSGSSKKMSTAKKVAIGVAAVAAVAGVSYVAVKAHKKSVYNKAAHAAIQRAIRSADRAASGRYADGNYYKKEWGKYRTNPGYGAEFNIVRGEVQGFTRNKHLTGHSGRVTKLGASRHRANYYRKKAINSPITSDYMTNPFNDRRLLEGKANRAETQFGNEVRYRVGNGKSHNLYRYDDVNKLRRRKR